MRVLIIHPEAQFFAGAERMLLYFAEAAQELDLTIATVAGSRLDSTLPQHISRIAIPDNRPFSPGAFGAAVRALWKAHRKQPFKVIQAWAARDWELAATLGRLIRVPVVGTLHDHASASFHSRGRRALMRWAVRIGMDRVICVSEAVRRSCLSAGYPAAKLTVIHNGIPLLPVGAPIHSPGHPVRLGFMGVFSERKGMLGLFQTIDALSQVHPEGWELAIAGGTQDSEGELLVRRLEDEFSHKPWWPRVRWVGWVKQPEAFYEQIDLFLCPSSEFDPFPTVLLEAARAGIPVLASDVGGIAEIVEDGKTGWVFPAGHWKAAAERLSGLISDPGCLGVAGGRARERMERCFAAGKMIARYRDLYSTLQPDE
jgi:glycosyltransferase involved in cell wall biosynthesis